MTFLLTISVRSATDIYMMNDITSELTTTTTVLINVKLHKQLKKKLIDKGISFSEWVRLKMEEDLRDGEAER